MPKTTIVGNLLYDPEIHKIETKKDGKIVDMVSMIIKTVEVNKDDSQYFKVEHWGKTAKQYYQNLCKGNMVKTECYIMNNNYLDKNGKKHYEFRFITYSLPVILQNQNNNREAKSLNKNTKGDNSMKDSDNKDNNFNFEDKYIEY